MRVSPAYYMDANPANTCDSCKEIIIILMVFLQISILYIIYPVILIGALALLLGLMLINLFGGNIPFIEEINRASFWGSLAILIYLGSLVASLFLHTP
jgi:hypothetical protein